jgi:hypothetical protein
MKTRRYATTFVLAMALTLSMSAAGFAAAKKAPPKKAPTIQDNLNAALASYLTIQNALAWDKTAGVQDAAKALAKSADAATKLAEKDKKKNDALLKTLKQVKAAALKLDVKNLVLADARTNFKGLSDAASALVKNNFPKDLAGKYATYYCPMAKASWLQATGAQKRNPYYGSEMPDCGKNM